MNLFKFFLPVFLLLFVQQSFSQRNYDSYNRLGINGGLVLFDISTEDFQTRQGTGFMGGFTSRGSFYNNFDLIYGINYYNSSLEVALLRGEDSEFVKYTIQGAQIRFLGSYNIVPHHLSLEFGPALHVNGKMKLDDETYKNNYVFGYNELRAGDLEDINRINFRLVGGLTFGFEDFRISGQYQYGVTNVLGKLNDAGFAENSDFEGHSSTLIASAVFFF